MRDTIEVVGARQNNLKNIHVKLPRNQLTVITGVSGSGKSSLAFDVIFGEGQRLFLESLSTYARSRVIQVRRPDVDFVFGLSSVVSIDQHTSIRNFRSTVGTLTDISTYLRLLYSTMGKAYCPYCDKNIPVRTSNQIVEKLFTLPKGTMVELLAPVKKIYGEDYRYLFDDLRRKRIGSLRINGEGFDIGENISLNEEEDYQIEAFIDKFEITSDQHQTLLDGIKECQRIGEGFIKINFLSDTEKNIDVTQFFEKFACPEHYVVMGELLPWYFSPNEGDSACLTCGGLGVYRKAVPYLMVENEKRSIMKGAINERVFNVKHPFKYLVIWSLAKHYNFSLHVPFKELSPDHQNLIFYGTKGEKFELLQPDDLEQVFSNVGKKVAFEGLIPPIDRWYKDRFRTQSRRQAQSTDDHIYFRGMTEVVCPDCNGSKLLPSRLQVRINDRNIYEIGQFTLTELRAFLDKLIVTKEREHIEIPIIEEIKKRLDLLYGIGVGYLSLNRNAHTLSGGEIQRVRMSTQIGSGLMGMLYILDEPSIGLHQRDNHRIIETLKKLRDIGNTIIVVEHDLEMMYSADWIIDMGPGSGDKGGEIVAQGDVQAIKIESKSLTGQYLSGKQEIVIPKSRRKGNGEYLNVLGASQNNLKKIDVKIPLNQFVCVTGVSGSGKSSLVNDIVTKALVSKLRDRRVTPGKHKKIEGLESLKDVRIIDQSPIGRNSRSNPATYVGFWDKIREVFSSQPEAIQQGYTKTTFSYNSKDSGRCEECEGTGEIVTQLQFMPDVRSICPVCKGKRFKNDILEILYTKFNIADILGSSVEKALDIFKDIRLIKHKLQVMFDLGLGYLKLGQSSTTLSGGEAQRIKLANELGKLKRLERNLYVFDEPSIGLHLADIDKLLKCMNQLVKSGNSVIVIEHNLDIIKMADYIIDLGPEGGNKGGYLVAAGTPEQISEVENSYTGQYLKKHLFTTMEE
ncbi:MAG: excinuclease ABC subunit UvrA [Candidatus Hodarchaeales archaeon]|jgi:excinuclease ABC subunit A